MKELAKTICEAARLYDESWDTKNKVYKMTLRTACDMAAEAAGYDTRATQPIYLLLYHCENSALAWAESII